MWWSQILLFLMGQSCFINCHLYEYLYIKELKTWTEAQLYCREKHTDLATVTNMTDMKRLLSTREGYMREAWIGLYDQTDGIRTWYWSLPGVEFNERETNWKPGEPNDFRGMTENCGVLLRNLEWLDIPCGLERHFICYDDKVILIKENKTWEDALYYCRDHYHDLVTITSLDEQRWIQEKAKNASTDYVWIGLRYNCLMKAWFWVCKENWGSNQSPASERWKNDCDMSGAMDAGGQHKWFQRNPSEELNFICSKN
ncbi:C-type mannose receptor 2-like isoform X5 [Cyprinodon tularosa]|uniref:C-type mannose receptor 2-like isoform X5 n=1 Tax=Cyprinodon tularosa TaxID=77115 RepID=UPI0018E23E0E|nr:C-type mannose receptor 2-like isoform X5 [Cyprinodon tularosa]